MTRSRPHLCMVVHATYPLAEPRVEREAKAARDAGYVVTVVALKEAGDAPHEVVDGVEVHRVPVRHRRGIGPVRLAIEYLHFALRAAWAVERLRRHRPIDVVQVHAPPDFLVVAGLPAKLRGARLLLDVHDLSTHIWKARFGAGLLGRLASAVVARVQAGAARSADLVVTVHEPYVRELARQGIDASKLAVVMNSADETLIERALSFRAAERDAAFTVAYHGTLTPWYGVELVLEALASLEGDVPGARATVIGDGDALPALRERARALGVADRVAFSGRYLPVEEALRRVSAADCGVVPNRATLLNRFALSSKLFEYVALGIPVVAARLETLSAHFGPDEVTFFEPEDAEALAEALRWVALHPEEARARAERARRRAKDYSWARQRRHYVRLLARPAGATA